MLNNFELRNNLIYERKSDEEICNDKAIAE